MNQHRRRHLRQALQWAGLTLAASSPAARAGLFSRGAKPVELRPMRAVVWKEFLGLNAQFQWFAPAVARRQIERLKALNLQWVRLGLHWMVHEPEEGQFKLAPIDQTMAMVHEAGLRNITYVVGTPRFATSVAPNDPYAKYFDKFPPKDPKVFAQRLMMLAKRYPQVDVWQVWNEPNIPGFWAPKADPEGYGRLLLPSVQALRATVPDKPIAMAGMAYYSEMAGRPGLMIEEMGKLGAFKLDLVVAYHPYTPRPEGADNDERDLLVHVPNAHRWLRGAGVKQIWATEWGWSSYDGPKVEQPIVGEDGQADYTLRRLALMAALDYDRIFLFTLSDLDARAMDRDRSYGLLRENGEPKPVYHALSRFLDICGPRIEPAAPFKIDGGAPQGFVGISWQRPDGRRLWMVWAQQAVTVRLPEVKAATLHQPLQGTRRVLKADGQGLKVAVTTSLQILVTA